MPGRKPNIAERAGVLEDYILADARVVAPESSGSDSVGTAGVTQPPVPAAGAMYKVEHIADERLRPLVGKRVEVIGRIDVEADEMKTAGTAGASTPPQPDRSIGPDRIELPEFEASSIREIAGVCPATPPGR